MCKLHKVAKCFVHFVVKDVDKHIIDDILKLAPGNAGSHQVLIGEPPLVDAQGEVEKNRKTREWSGNEDGRAGIGSSEVGEAMEVGTDRAIAEIGGERTAIDGTRWRTQVAGQVEGQGFRFGLRLRKVAGRMGT